MPDPVLAEDERLNEIRAIARQEVASLCGLVLGRLGEVREARPGFELEATLKSIFGEALRDFGGTADEPGEEPA